MSPKEATTTDPLMSREVVAEYLGVNRVTLEKWAQLGTGPVYIKVGRLVRYRKSDLDRWLAEQTVIPNAGNDLPTAA